MVTINYPASLDDDSSLFDVEENETIEPEHHDNLKDAVIELEKKVGVDNDENFVKRDGSLPLTGTWDVGGQDVIGLQKTSTTTLVVDERTDYTPIAAPPHLEGRTYYDKSDKALSYMNDESEVSLQIGREEWLRAYNDSGSTITDGSAVYVSGIHGNTGLPTIALAKADDKSTTEAVGLATHDIESSSTGYVCISGATRDIDTSGFSAGDTVYVSPATAGDLTNTPPSSPNFRVRVGVVTKATQSTGKINVILGNTRADIFTTGAVPFAGADGEFVEDPDGLTYDSATSTLDVTTIEQSGTTVVDESRTLSGGTGINSIGNLSQNRTISVDQTFSPTWTGDHAWDSGTSVIFGATAGNFEVHQAGGSYQQFGLPTSAPTPGIENEAGVMWLDTSVSPSELVIEAVDGAGTSVSTRIDMT